MHWMLMPLRRYAEFSGRSRRMEFWMWVLFQFLINAVFLGLASTAISVMNESDVWAAIILLYLAYLLTGLAFIIPGLAVSVRRLHDTDRSGWNILWTLVPFVGGIVLLVFYLSDGTPGPNRYGQDPKGQNAATFA